MTLDEVSRSVSEGSALEVEVRSVELAIYVPYLVEGAQRLPITDKQGKALLYPSRYAALRALKHTGLAHADVVHISAYDEMIGVPSTPGQNEMRERVLLGSL